MFAILAISLLYSLLTFGAVLPSSWLLLKIVWLAGIAVCLVITTVQRSKLSCSMLFLFVLALLLFKLVQPKLAVGLVAALWAWAAVLNDNEIRTLRFFHILLAIGLLEALLGLVQFFVSPGWIFGYVGTNRSSGTLINRNHFAGLLEMVIPVTLGFAYIAVRRYSEMARPYTYLLAGAFMGLAVCFSLSRMGIFSFVLTIFFLATLVRLRHARNPMATALGLGLLVLVAAGAFWIGLDVIVARYANLLEEDAIIREGRAQVFRDTIRMIADAPFGVGVGNYQDVFRKYQTFRPQLLFDHAHNDYLETAVEWGVPVAFAFWAFVVFVLVSAVRKFLAPGSPEQRGILLASLGAIFSILVHSLTDFNLQIPSNAMLFFTFVGISLRFSLDGSRESPKEILRQSRDSSKI